MILVITLTVLEGDQPECIQCGSPRPLEDEDDVGAVDPFDVGHAGVEGFEEAHDVVVNRGPDRLVEGRAYSIGAQGVVGVHGLDGPTGFVDGEGGDEQGRTQV